MAMHRIGRTVVLEGSVRLVSELEMAFFEIYKGPDIKKTAQNTINNTLFSKFLYHSMQPRTTPPNAETSDQVPQGNKSSIDDGTLLNFK